MRELAGKTSSIGATYALPFSIKKRKFEMTNLWSTNHSRYFGAWNLSGNVEAHSHHLMDLGFQLGLNLGQKIGFDPIEEEIILPGLVYLMHLLMQVIVNTRDSVHFGSDTQQLLFNT